MRIKFHILGFTCILLWAISAVAGPKPHVISFGKWTSVQWYAGTTKNNPLDMKIAASTSTLG